MVHITLFKITNVILLVTAVLSKETRIPHTYVVEFEQPVESFASKRHLENRRLSFYNQLERLNINYNIRHEYDIVNAVSLSFQSPDDSTLFFDRVHGYKKAWPVNTVTKPTVFRAGASSKEEIASLFEYYNSTGVLLARNKLGLLGAGIKVGVIDTGVDYLHPGLGGCFGAGCKVAIGYDFVGDDYTGTNAPKPDDDPRDTCNGHGTHVSGIIAANDTLKGFTGVAPSATIGAYRIFGCHGSSSDDMIMKAMERAYHDGMDVINMSLGDNGWPNSPASMLADILALKGMIVCAAAGNEGAMGIFEVGAPSLGRHALSIASIDNTRVLAHALEVGGLTLGYATSNGQVFNFSTAEVVPTSSKFLTEGDACSDIGVDLQGKVALVARGKCTFTDKVLNVQKAGAIGVIIYNNSPGPITPSAPDKSVTIEYGGISMSDGLKLFNYLTTHEDKLVEFPQLDKSFPVVTGRTISSFSSWGLGPDMSMKPDLSAPGGHIFSTYPIDLGSYAILSGTSMATPFVAGVVALIEESRGGNRGIGVNEIRSMLINNGNPVNLYQAPSTNGTTNGENNNSTAPTQLDSIAKQGSGQVDVYKALLSDTLISPEQIRLNDLSHHAPNNEYTFTIQNNGNLAADYIISHLSAASAQGYGYNQVTDSILPLSKPNILEKDVEVASVQINTPSVRVEANQTANVTVVIAPPANALGLPPSIYSGYITVSRNGEGDRQSPIYIPYAGFSADTSQLPVLMKNATMPRIKMMNSVSAEMPAVLIFQLIQASPLVKISVVGGDDEKKEYGYVPGGYNRYLGRSNIDKSGDAYVLPWFGNVANGTEQASLGSLHDATPLDINGIEDNLAKALIEHEEQRVTTDAFPRMGTFLSDGEYRLKVEALGPFGNKDVEKDFDVWYSPIIQVKSPTPNSSP